MKNFCILGGGTAGWFTALFIKKLFPNENITLIQGETIGTIGVGEGTVPNIIDFLKKLEIDPLDVLVKTKGTIKNGISFENWNGDDKKYFHSFSDLICDFYIPNIFDSGCADYHLMHLMDKNLKFEEYLYAHKLSYSNLVDIERYKYALHFDAKLLSEYLEKIGKERGIHMITGDFSHVEQTECGIISAVVLKNKNKIDLDFIFDCSGFARLLIDKVYKQRWISYSKHLPMKKAIPFWLENDKTIEPYTTAVALKHGWIWKIPLQHRIGSGYIFDSDYIDEDKALDEAQSYFNRNLVVRKSIPFEAGRFENVWIRNCMAVGLSASFIEPLEATSLFLTIQQLETFRDFVNEIDNFNPNSIKLFNQIIANNMDDTLSFIYLHYMTKRNDSEFWKNFKKNYVIPVRLENILEDIKENNLRYFQTSDTKTTANFSLYSYLQVIKGIEVSSNNVNLNNYDLIVPNPQEYKNLLDKIILNAVDHSDFLKGL